MSAIGRVLPYRATLRIYEPITAFTQSEQDRFLNAPISTRTFLDEEKQNLIRTIKNTAPKISDDGFHIIEVNNIRYISPWKTAIRVLNSFQAFQNTIPAPLLPYFVPEKLSKAIDTQSELIQFITPHSLEETWMIPPRWFSLFHSDEVSQGKVGNVPFVYYRTNISNAKERCRFSHQTVVGAFGNGPIEHEIELLLQWLDSFHPDSIVELDYGGLAYYLEKVLIENGERGLVDDTSVEDLQSSLAGLANGDGSAAGVGYERLIKRWRQVANYEQAM